MFLAPGFINNCSKIHGVPLPDRMPNHQDSNVALLPSDLSKSYVYQMYLKTSSSSIDISTRAGDLKNYGVNYVNM